MFESFPKRHTTSSGEFRMLRLFNRQEKLPTMQQDVAEIILDMLDDYTAWHCNEYVAVNIDTGAIIWHNGEHHHLTINLPNVGKISGFNKKDSKTINIATSKARHRRALEQLRLPCPTHSKVLEALGGADKIAKGYYKDEVFANHVRDIFASW